MDCRVSKGISSDSEAVVYRRIKKTGTEAVLDCLC